MALLGFPVTVLTVLIPMLLVTSFTTAVGFASLTVSDITILRQLGQFAPLAFGSNFLVTLLLVPAMLRYFPVPRAIREGSEQVDSSLLARVLRAIGSFDLHRRGWIVAGSGALLVVALVGMPRIRVDNDLLGFFRSGSEIHRRIEDIHRSLAGVSLFYLVADTGTEGGAIQPETLAAVDALQRFLDDTGEVDRTLSLVDYVKTMNREMNGGDPAAYRIPDSADLVAQYLLLLHPSDVEKHVDYDQSGVNILVRHNLTATRDLDALLARIDEYVAANVDPRLHITASGEGILMGRAADSMATDMMTGLSYTIAVVGVVCSFFFMSLRAGLLSLIPNILPIGFIMGLMGLLDIPLNVGTTMIAAIAVGIAVDDTVHYMARNSIELDRHNDQTVATLETLRSEGRAIIATSVALAGGFLTLTLSTFVPMAYFGGLSAIVMLVALAADLTITPALMSSTRLITLWNIIALKMKGNIVEVAPLLHGFSRWEARKVVLMGSLSACAPGDYVIRQGDRDTESMYLVVTGALRVARHQDGHERTLARLGPGAVFGEMALVDTRERSADVVADVPSEVLRLTAADLDHLRRRFPRTALKLFRNLATILSARLRETNQVAVSPAPEAGRAA